MFQLFIRFTIWQLTTLIFFFTYPPPSSLLFNSTNNQSSSKPLNFITYFLNEPFMRRLISTNCRFFAGKRKQFLFSFLIIFFVTLLRHLTTRFYAPTRIQDFAPALAHPMSASHCLHFGYLGSNLELSFQLHRCSGIKYLPFCFQWH